VVPCHAARWSGSPSCCPAGWIWKAPPPGRCGLSPRLITQRCRPAVGAARV